MDRHASEAGLLIGVRRMHLPPAARTPGGWRYRRGMGRRGWALVVIGVSGLLATACGTTLATPAAPRTGPATDCIRLELATGTASPGQVVTSRLLGSRLADRRSSGLVEVTCGAKDTRVSHPVQGVTGAATPPTDRAPEDQPFDLPATAAVRFTVPQVSTGVCVVARPVRTGATVVYPRTPLDIH